MGILVDLTRKRFGKLLVISRYTSKNEHGYVYWFCKCDCGNEKIVRGAHLTSGGTKSCGCFGKQSRHLNGRYAKKGYGASTKHYVFHRYKRDAEKRKIEFSLSEERFLELAIKDCFYCGEKSQNIEKSRTNNGDFIYNGLDRINSKLGYTEENVVPCCKTCNFAKREMSIQEFYKWIEKVYKYKTHP